MTKGIEVMLKGTEAMLNGIVTILKGIMIIPDGKIARAVRKAGVSKSQGRDKRVILTII
jgi:hypothetical protein